MKMKLARRREVGRIGLLNYIASTAAALWVVTASSGCATSSRSANASKISAAPHRDRYSEMRIQLRKQQEVIEDLREKNLVLEGRVSNGTGTNTESRLEPKSENIPVPFHPSASEAFSRDGDKVPIGKVPMQLPPKLEAHEIKGEDSGLTDEQQRYLTILDAYRRHDSSRIGVVVTDLLKGHPDSVFADNALYLAGMLEFERGELPAALAYMDQILNVYPLGNKAVAALFAKGMIEKRGQRFAAAERDLSMLSRLYPGSPEALRVGVELKTLAFAGKKKRGL